MSGIEFTGERFVPGLAGEIAHEHWHRYAFARRFVEGRVTLDVACGEGYGSALLASVAKDVTGVDVAADAVAHASATYRDHPRLRFLHGSAAALPLADASVGAVVSFETIEHLPRDLQPRMMAEIARVLADDGVLVLSAPDPAEYSHARNYRNPFHLHEPTRAELDLLLAHFFEGRRWYRQRRFFGSALWCEDASAAQVEVLEDRAGVIAPAPLPPAMYGVVVAARRASLLPPAAPRLSLFTDAGEAELQRLDAQSGEVLRLDGLLAQRDRELSALTASLQALEAQAADARLLIGEHEAQLTAAKAALAGTEAARAAERDAARAELAGTLARLERALAERDDAHASLGSERQAVASLTEETARLSRAVEAQERIVAYRQSARWWLALPWLRLRLLWRRWRG